MQKSPVKETIFCKRDDTDMYGVAIRLVGSLKLWVSFAKEPYKRDYILQKRPITLQYCVERRDFVEREAGMERDGKERDGFSLRSACYVAAPPSYVTCPVVACTQVETSCRDES